MKTLMISFIICLISLIIGPAFTKEYKDYYKEHQVRLWVEESGFCKGAPLMDYNSTAYCGFYSMLNPDFFN